LRTREIQALFFEDLYDKIYFAVTAGMSELSGRMGEQSGRWASSQLCLRPAKL